jgi:alkylated DNA repair dioxygenase AlkB
MFLFDSDRTLNLLPRDGTVNYFGKIFSAEESAFYFKTLLTSLDWKNDEAIIMGKHFVTPRKVAWYADQPFTYTYSKITKQALLWTKELKELKEISEKLTGLTFNSCLANLYHNGEEGMAWHSDAEKALGPEPAIASLTFGAERKFSFKHKVDKTLVSLLLENGSLLVMKGQTQANWLHRLPPTTKVKAPRVNLTFRSIFGH